MTSETSMCWSNYSNYSCATSIVTSATSIVTSAAPIVTSATPIVTSATSIVTSATSIVTIVTAAIPIVVIVTIKTHIVTIVKMVTPPQIALLLFPHYCSLFMTHFSCCRNQVLTVALQAGEYQQRSRVHQNRATKLGSQV